MRVKNARVAVSDNLAVMQTADRVVEFDTRDAASGRRTTVVVAMAQFDDATDTTLATTRLPSGETCVNKIC